jgi:hypothetical protein
MPGRKLASTWQGCCGCLCSRRHPPCQPTAVAAAAACRQWQQRRCWQHGNKVNEDNDNNMTTTQQPTRQPKRQPTRRGNDWVAGKKLCSKMCFFWSVQVCLNPWTMLRQADHQRYLFSGRKGMFLCFWVKKLCLWTRPKKHRGIRNTH